MATQQGRRRARSTPAAFLARGDHRREEHAERGDVQEETAPRDSQRPGSQRQQHGQQRHETEHQPCGADQDSALYDTGRQDPVQHTPCEGAHGVGAIDDARRSGRQPESALQEERRARDIDERRRAAQREADDVASQNTIGKQPDYDTAGVTETLTARGSERRLGHRPQHTSELAYPDQSKYHEDTAPRAEAENRSAYRRRDYRFHGHGAGQHRLCARSGRAVKQLRDDGTGHRHATTASDAQAEPCRDQHLDVGRGCAQQREDRKGCATGQQYAAPPGNIRDRPQQELPRRDADQASAQRQLCQRARRTQRCGHPGQARQIEVDRQRRPSRRDCEHEDRGRSAHRASPISGR